MFVIFWCVLDFSRGHSLDLRKVIFPPELLESDMLGYYKPLAIAGYPAETYFYEDYPLSTEAFLFVDSMSDPFYEFEDPANDFKRSLKNSEGQDKKAE